MNEVSDISSRITIKNDLANNFKGTFRLFREENEELKSNILIYQKDVAKLDSEISIRVTRDKELISQIKIVYSDYADISSVIDTVSISEMHSMINVPPHNRFKGSFNLMAAPEETVILNPIEDATTRSREDLRTINYGDTNSMMIGQNDNEEFYSFLKFEDLNTAIPDLKIIKSVKLRLYYTAFVNGANIQLGQPNTIWREMGITDANRPYSIETFKENEYTVNATERYIEFDFLDISKRWLNKELANYGIIISSDDNSRYYLMTRESLKPPELIIKYITSKIYSIGRSELGSKIFIYGAGRKEMNSRINVHSELGQAPLNSSIYIHRYEDPMALDIASRINISRPDMQSSVFVKIEDKEELYGSFKVTFKGNKERESRITISRPDLYSRLTVDNNMTLKSSIIIKQIDKEILCSSISISRPDLYSHITISEYTSGRVDLYSTVTIKKEHEIPLLASITISKPDLGSVMHVKVEDYAELHSMIQAREIRALPSSITINRPDLPSSINVMYHEDMPGSIFVRESSYMDSVIDVIHAADVASCILVKNASDMASNVTIHRPDLPSSMKIKVTREKELDSRILIKQRDVEDLTCIIRVGGSSNRNMIIIF